MIRFSDAATSAAVLIGVAQYADPERWQPLPAVTANVDDLKAALTSPDHWGLPPERCVTLHDPVDRGDVLEAITAAAETARDTVLVYYAGHGSSTETDLLLTLASTTRRNLNFQSVEFEAVRRIMRQRRAMNAVI